MRKSNIVALCIGIFIGGLGICYADTNKYSITDSISNISYFPALQEKYETVRSYFTKSKPQPPCKQYGNLQLMESLDHGRLWPQHRRKFRQDYLDKMIKQVNSFPTAQQKLTLIRRLQKRVKNLEKKCLGRRSS